MHLLSFLYWIVRRCYLLLLKKHIVLFILLSHLHGQICESISMDNLEVDTLVVAFLSLLSTYLLLSFALLYKSYRQIGNNQRSFLGVLFAPDWDIFCIGMPLT